MTFPAQAQGIRRHSLLKRNPAHSRDFFSTYYEKSHGPLAASTAGFRKYSTRYIQNHVEPLKNGDEPAFDGITMTTQLLRDDYYGEGFFKEPDYVEVKPDEIFLFDLTKTVSVLGQEAVVLDGPPTPFKVVLLTSSADLDSIGPMSKVTRVVRNNLDIAAASALGFEESTFAFDTLVEIWFEDGKSKEQALESTQSNTHQIWLPVREVEIFSADRPWIG